MQGAWVWNRCCAQPCRRTRLPPYAYSIQQHYTIKDLYRNPAEYIIDLHTYTPTVCVQAINQHAPLHTYINPTDHVGCSYTCIHTYIDTYIHTYI